MTQKKWWQKWWHFSALAHFRLNNDYLYQQNVTGWIWQKTLCKNHWNS